MEISPPIRKLVMVGACYVDTILRSPDQYNFNGETLLTNSASLTFREKTINYEQDPYTEGVAETLRTASKFFSSFNRRKAESTR